MKVEKHIFEALEKSKLIPNREECAWAKCGRTDKGVSATGQTCSLYIRSSCGGVKWCDIKELEDFKHKWMRCLPEVIHDWEGHSMDEMDRSYRYKYGDDTESLKLSLNSIRDLNNKNGEELDYITMINRLMPEDIRILGWAPVDPTFDARFACKARKYHYYFSSIGLDIELMRKACNYFLGTHDFRNFSKIDTNKVERDGFFTRTVKESCIESTSDPEYFRFCVKGKAFLWHQVRK